MQHRAIALDDSARLVRLTASARVVAFGDVTHGTHEMFAARLQVIPALVDDGGFRILAVEGPYAQYVALDEFVRTGVGDPAALLRNDPYYFWNTQEMLELILWARGRNAAGIAPPIRIAGLDAFEPIPVGKSVVATLRGIDAELAAFAEAEYVCLPRCGASIRNVRPRIEAKRTSFATQVAFDETVHAARVVEQGVEIDADFFRKRDPVMAENALWLAERGKVLMMGHNEHWGRTDYLLGELRFRSTGADLAAALGAGYFVIGSLILDGSFYAVRAEVTPRTVAEFTVDPPLPDDWAVAIDAGGLSSVVIPLFAPLPDWMLIPRRIRFAGSGSPMQVTSAELLGAKFDAVLYVRTSTPTLLRFFPVF